MLRLEVNYIYFVYVKIQLMHYILLLKTNKPYSLYSKVKFIYSSFDILNKTLVHFILQLNPNTAYLLYSKAKFNYSSFGVC